MCGGHVCGVMRGERVKSMDALIHSPMAACLVTHNTGIAQSSPDPFLCDTDRSQFSALFMQRRRRGDVKNPSILLPTLVEASAFELTLSNLKRNTTDSATLLLFLSYLLQRCARLPRHQYGGSGAADTFTQRARNVRRNFYIQ